MIQCLLWFKLSLAHHYIQSEILTQIKPDFDPVSIICPKIACIPVKSLGF